MKKVKLLRMAVGLMALTSAVPGIVHADLLPELKSYMPRATFIPPGFDWNDNAQIILRGEFPSTCFQLAEPSFEVIGNTVRVRNNVYHHTSSWCLFMVTPYTQVVSVGMLPKGNYNVEIVDHNERPNLVGTLPIGEPMNPDSQDDYVYAQVDEVTFETYGNSKYIRLKGMVPSDYRCAVMDDIALLYNTKGLVEVLPKVKVLMRNCRPAVMVKLNEVREIKSPWLGEHLFHIRTMNGHAVNKFFTIK